MLTSRFTSKSRRGRGRQQKASRMAVREIARQLGLSVSRVSRIVAEQRALVVRGAEHHDPGPQVLAG
jgi:hypothetical protein